MTTRIVPSTPVKEGAGVIVHRSIGMPGVGRHDPFLMLDHFATENPDDYIAGFPSHPHRGFTTLTYMLDGKMRHKDSMGNEGVVNSGDAQWMKAASGVIHSEMPEQEDGARQGFQLWINLPAVNKMDNPDYQDILAENIPNLDTDFGQVKVMAGQFQGVAGPLTDDDRNLQFFDVHISAEQTGTFQLPADNNSFVFIHSGQGNLNDSSVKDKDLVLMESQASVEIHATSNMHVIIVSGKPINEPIYQHGPFVMNTREEIETAFYDYQQGKLVRAST